MTVRPLLLGIALSCLALGASAQDALLDAARAQLDRRNAAAAYALLADAEAQRAGERRFDYLLGIAALDAGQVTRAIFALERVVLGHPADALARAELGRAYLAAGDLGAAREQLDLARQGEVPPAAAAAMARVLALLDAPAAPAGPRLSGYVELGGGHDSNVNSATQQGEFAIPAFGGLLFQTDPEHRQRRDLFVSAAGGLGAEVALSPGWKAIAAAHLRAALHHRVSDMDTLLLDSTVGLRRTASATSQTVALQHHHARVGGRAYRDASGVAAQWQWQLGPHLQASGFGQWSRQAYRLQDERDSDRRLLGAGLTHRLGAGGPLVHGSAWAVDERARRAGAAHFGHRGGGLRLGLDHGLAPTVAAFAEAQYEQRRYRGLEPFFDTGRRDRQRELSAGVRWQLDPAWQLTAQARQVRAASNVVLYDYARRVFQITVHRSFS